MYHQKCIERLSNGAEDIFEDSCTEGHATASNKIEMERHEACFKSNSDQEFKYFCLMPCNALFGDKCYPFFRGVLEIQSSPEHQPYFMCCRKWRVDC